MSKAGREKMTYKDELLLGYGLRPKWCFVLGEGAGTVYYCTRLFNKYLWSTYCVLGTVLGKGDTEMNEIMRVLFCRSYVLVRGK